MPTLARKISPPKWVSVVSMATPLLFLSWLVRLPEAGSLISGLGLIQTHTVAMDVSQALSRSLSLGKSPALENLCYIILAFLPIKRSLCKADALAVWTTDRNCIFSAFRGFCQIAMMRSEHGKLTTFLVTCFSLVFRNLRLKIACC